MATVSSGILSAAALFLRANIACEYYVEQYTESAKILALFCYRWYNISWKAPKV